MRAEWIAKRRGHASVTQLHFARQGLVTEEMRHVAKRERLPHGQIREEVARGRMIIPANVNHPELEPMAIGFAATCKINANIGNSAVVSGVEEELEKLRVCIKYGADTVMDLSTGGDIPQIREAILRHSTAARGHGPHLRVPHTREGGPGSHADGAPRHHRGAGGAGRGLHDHPRGRAAGTSSRSRLTASRASSAAAARSWRSG